MKIDWKKVWKEFEKWFDNDTKIQGRNCFQKKPVAKTFHYKRITRRIEQLVNKQLKEKK
jgi:hypothetical protein